MRWTFLFLLISIIAAQPSLSENQRSVRFRGTDLAQQCESFRHCAHQETCMNKDILPSGECIGYISGIADSLDREICISPNENTQQLINTTIGFMKRNPQLLPHDAVTVVRAALREDFPCTN